MQIGNAFRFDGCPSANTQPLTWVPELSITMMKNSPIRPIRDIRNAAFHLSVAEEAEPRQCREVKGSHQGE